MKPAGFGCLTLWLLFAVTGPANGVENGDFEDVLIGPPYNSSDPADIPGWTHTGSVGDALLWSEGYVDSGGDVLFAGHKKQFVTIGGGFDGSGRKKRVSPAWGR